MRIQHNIMAMNAYRNYTSNVNAMKSNLEKLSSGYKINRAGDDAAGLAISEKMRAQITGLNAAQKNVKDGISLVQTAEGAMQEVQDMLNRMVYLATQSANGTYDNEVDRANLQKELVQLRDEIDRIADSANFNGIKLLDGSKADAITAATETVDLAGTTFTALTGGDLLATGTTGVIGDDTITYQGGTSAVKTKLEIDTSKIEWTGASNSDTLTITIGNYALTMTATTAATTGDKADLDTLLKTAIGTGITNAEVVAGTEYNVTYANGKITVELAEDPTSATADAVLDPSWKIQVGKSAGTVTTQWNDGSLNMVRGEKPVTSVLANTTVAAGKLGITGTGEDADGKAIEIDGQKFVIASGDDSKFAKVDGATVVKVKDDDTTEKVMEKLANAINAAGTVWSAGVNTKGELTLAQVKTDNKEANEAFKTKDGIAGTIKVGTVAVKTTEPTEIQKNAAPLTLQIGDTAETFNQLTVKIGDIHATGLGIDKIAIDSQKGAADAVAVIKNAINTVSSIRGDLGATQNRLEHTANNLSVMQENITDAESSIRDTDVAEEMMAYTKNNILIQSAQAMLAQANQVPQGVLQLLQ